MLYQLSYSRRGKTVESKMERVTRLELVASTMARSRSSQLSYTRIANSGEKTGIEPRVPGPIWPVLCL